MAYGTLGIELNNQGARFYCCSEHDKQESTDEILDLFANALLFLVIAKAASLSNLRSDATWGTEINEMLVRHRYALFIVFSMVLGGAFAYGLAHRPPAVVVNVYPPKPTQLPTPTAAPTPLHCHIVGAVDSPGVYTLPPGSLVRDAIQAAGGPTADADLERLNLAAVVEDQAQIVVPRRPGGPSPSALDSPMEQSTEPVNINTAGNDTLEALPGIGPVLAQEIINYRNEHGPFKSIEDLINVDGIAERKMNTLRPLITVGP